MNEWRACQTIRSKQNLHEPRKYRASGCGSAAAVRTMLYAAPWRSLSAARTVVHPSCWRRVRKHSGFCAKEEERLFDSGRLICMPLRNRLSGSFHGDRLQRNLYEFGMSVQSAVEQPQFANYNFRIRSRPTSITRAVCASKSGWLTSWAMRCARWDTKLKCGRRIRRRPVEFAQSCATSRPACCMRAPTVAGKAAGRRGNESIARRASRSRSASQWQPSGPIVGYICRALASAFRKAHPN